MEYENRSVEWPLPEKDKIVDEASRRIIWSYYGLDNYDWFVYYYFASPKKQAILRKRYLKLKRQMLGPCFKEADGFPE